MEDDANKTCLEDYCMHRPDYTSTLLYDVTMQIETFILFNIASLAETISRLRPSTSSHFVSTATNSRQTECESQWDDVRQT